MSYKGNSNWNDKNEIKCLIIFKQLEQAGFPRGMQAELSKKLAKSTGLKYGSISAKISNYKSVFGVNNHSNASSNTSYFVRKYGNLSIEELQKLI